VGVYGATLGFYELWRAYDRKVSYREEALRLVMLAIPAVAVFGHAIDSVSIGTRHDLVFGVQTGLVFRIMNGYN